MTSTKIDVIKLRPQVADLWQRIFSQTRTWFVQGWFHDCPSLAAENRINSFSFCSAHLTPKQLDASSQSITYEIGRQKNWSAFTQYAKEQQLIKFPCLEGSTLSEYLTGLNSSSQGQAWTFRQDCLAAPANLLPKNKALIERYLRMLTYQLTKHGLKEWSVGLQVAGRVNGRGGTAVIAITYRSDLQAGSREGADLLRMGSTAKAIPGGVWRDYDSFVHPNATLTPGQIMISAPILTAKFARQFRTAYDRILEITQCSRLL